MRAIVLALAAVLGAGVNAQPGTGLGPPVVFHDVTVVPMDSDRQLAGRSVLVVDGRIAAIGAADTLAVPDGAKVIDGRGQWLMPGLGEMHAHLPPVAQAEALDRVLELFLANGITTARGVLGEPGHLALRAAIDAGERDGPRIITSGPSLNGNTVRDAAHAVELVEAQKAAGYDLVKLHPGLERDAFDALMGAAKRVGLPVTGHVSAAVGIEHALAQGQDCIEHMDDYVRAMAPEGSPERSGNPGFFGLNAALVADRERIPALVEATRAAGAAISPTETLMVSLLGEGSTDSLLARPEYAYVSAETRAQWRTSRDNMQGAATFDRAAATRFLALRRELLKALHDAGVPIVLGSDAPQVFNVPGFSSHRELALMVAAGLTPYEALRTGTVEVARHLGHAAQRGTVAEGMQADLVLLSADPFADIGNAQRIVGVMRDGRWHDRADLDARLARVRAAVGEHP
jgi:imidazolonepropionase-like amidohydrolase